eukprot:7226043-Pyramimonas_sp.AAC.1
MSAYPSSQGLRLHRPKTHRRQYWSRSRTRQVAPLSPLGPWLARGIPRRAAPEAWPGSLATPRPFHHSEPAAQWSQLVVDHHSR